MSNVDGYLFPCYFCGDPAGQMDDTIDYLTSSGIRLLKRNETRAQLIERYGSEENVGATVGMLWIDVEGEDYWSIFPSNNVEFISDMIAEGEKQGYTIGIYSSAYCWNPITGYSSAFKSYPLWYAHYDDK